MMEWPNSRPTQLEKLQWHDRFVTEYDKSRSNTIITKAWYNGCYEEDGNYRPSWIPKWMRGKS